MARQTNVRKRTGALLGLLLVLALVVGLLPGGAWAAAPDDGSLNKSSEDSVTLNNLQLLNNSGCLKVTSLGQGMGVTGSPRNVWAGVFITDQGAPKYVFCFDLNNPLAQGECYYRNQNIALEPQVAWLMANYPPGANLATKDLDGNGVVNDADHNIEAAARQVAIWKYTDNYVISGPDDVKNRVIEILGSVPSPLPQEYLLGQARLTIEPAYEVNALTQAEHTLTVWLKRGNENLDELDITVETNFGYFVEYAGSPINPTTSITVRSGVPIVLKNTSGYGGEATVTATVINQPVAAAWQHGTDS